MEYFIVNQVMDGIFGRKPAAKALFVLQNSSLEVVCIPDVKSSVQPG